MFQAPCRCDLVLGRKELKKIGLKFDFENNEMTWDDAAVQMKAHSADHSGIQDAMETNGLEEFALAESMLCDSLEEELFEDDDEDAFVLVAEEEEHEAEEAGCHSKKIPSSKCKKVTPEQAAEKCTHLNGEQKEGIKNVVKEHKELFNGKLGICKGEQVHLEIDKEAQPCHSRACPVPHAQSGVHKEELDRLVEIGAMEKTGRSEWIGPSFIKPKKDGRARWLSDFRGLNKALRRKVHLHQGFRTCSSRGKDTSI